MTDRQVESWLVELFQEVLELYLWYYQQLFLNQLIKIKGHYGEFLQMDESQNKLYKSCLEALHMDESPKLHL